MKRKKIESDIEEEVIEKRKKKNINGDRLEKKKRKRDIKKFFDKNKKKFLENDGEIDDMSYLELDEEEEYDLMCKFEDYYMKHIEKKKRKKKL